MEHNPSDKVQQELSTAYSLLLTDVCDPAADESQIESDGYMRWLSITTSAMLRVWINDARDCDSHHKFDVIVDTVAKSAPHVSVSDIVFKLMEQARPLRGMSVHEFCEDLEVAENLSLNGKLQLLEHCFRTATADGSCDPDDLELIDEFARVIVGAQPEYKLLRRKYVGGAPPQRKTQEQAPQPEEGIHEPEAEGFEDFGSAEEIFDDIFEDAGLGDRQRTNAAAEEEEQAPARSDENVSEDMTLEDAMQVLKIMITEELTEAALKTRYDERSESTDSKRVQRQIDAAYLLLKTHLQSVFLAAKKRFGYGPDEIPKREELMIRYNRLSDETDSKTEQTRIDAAYETLLKIAV